MTKSKAEKNRNAQLHSDNYVSGKLFKLQEIEIGRASCRERV